MIALDTNVLVHAHREETPLHAIALPRLQRMVPGATFPAVFAEACRDGGVQGNLAFDA